MFAKIWREKKKLFPQNGFKKGLYTSRKLRTEDVVNYISFIKSQNVKPGGSDIMFAPYMLPRPGWG